MFLWSQLIAALCLISCVHNEMICPPLEPYFSLGKVPQQGCQWVRANDTDGCPYYDLQCNDIHFDKTCYLPERRGPCKSMVTRYHYDTRYLKCLPFMYSGCGANANNFETINACLDRCGSVRPPAETNAARISCPVRPIPAPPPGCTYETVTGADGCPDYKLRCADRCATILCPPCNICENGKCKRDPNDSRCNIHPCANMQCPARHKCRLIGKPEDAHCVPDDLSPECVLPKDSGLCFGFFTNWYYDIKGRRCKEFVYGGCNGNENRFKSEVACKSRCFSNIATTSNPTTHSCASVVCPASTVCKIVNGRAECVQDLAKENARQLCNLPPETGRCRASIPQWYYDRNVDACLQFIYGGCEGNKNRFDTQLACEQTCRGRRSDDPIDVSNSRDNICARVRCASGTHCEVVDGTALCVADSNTGGGIRPAPVPKPRASAKCELAKDPGPCRALIERYYFNKLTNACEQFGYGGCLGNDNNFHTLAHCQQECAKGGPNCPEPNPARSGCRWESYAVDQQSCPLYRLICNPCPPISRPPVQRGCRLNEIRTADNCVDYQIRCDHAGTCPAVDGRIGVCFDQCRFDDECRPNQKCCSNGCGRSCTDVSQPRNNGGTCANVRCSACNECRMVVTTRNGQRTPRCIRRPNCCESGAIQVTCSVDPCQQQRCPGAAHCISSNCNSCQAHFYDQDWKKINCNNGDSDNVLVPIPTPSPTDVCATTQCPSCHRCVSVQTPNAGRAVGKCVKIASCCDGPTRCAVAADPCQTTPRCPNVAHCVPDFCTGCNVIHYDAQWNRVICNPDDQATTTTTQPSIPNNEQPCSRMRCAKCYECRNVRSPTSGNMEGRCVRKPSCCPRNQIVAQCFADPCQVTARCAGVVHCVSDYCGGCNAHFYTVDWNQIVCQDPPPSSSDDQSVTSTAQPRQGDDVDSPCASMRCKPGYKCVAFRTRAYCVRPRIGNLIGAATRGKREGVYRTKRQAGAAGQQQNDDACRLRQCPASAPICRQVRGQAICFKDEEQVRITCSHPVERGSSSCRLNVERWYYDRSSRQCFRFTYTGCEGNENRFHTANECEVACYGVTAKDINHSSPGQCPARSSLPATSCRSECHSDDECRGAKKCCLNSCGAQVCADAISGVQEAGRICRQAEDRGTCRAALPRWRYDASTQRCVRFTYGGCAGNDNNFVNEQLCQEFCRSVTECRIPPIARPPQGCHYNETTGPDGCPVFTLKCQSGSAADISGKSGTCPSRTSIGRPSLGCFASIRECVKDQDCSGQMKCCPNACSQGQENTGSSATTSCVQPILEAGTNDKSVCLKPKDQGPCRAFVNRHYYNHMSQRCELFSWGGCQSNGNNFFNESDCYALCQGVSNDGQRVCPVASTIPPFGSQCTFTSSNCMRDSNCGAAQKCCENSCGNKVCVDSIIKTKRAKDPICQMAPAQGTCLSSLPRWYYSPATGKCHTFVYSSCGGNQNNFVTEQECLQKCDDQAVTQDASCLEPQRRGSCLSSLTRWFYNQQTQRCETFTYGGCEANGNNYVTQTECQNKCERHSSEPSASAAPPREICLQPSNAGPCKAAVTKWYYNRSTRRCERFSYGGCGGNGNNFYSEPECKRECRLDISDCPRSGTDESQPPTGCQYIDEFWPTERCPRRVLQCTLGICSIGRCQLCQRCVMQHGRNIPKCEDTPACSANNTTTVTSTSSKSGYCPAFNFACRCRPGEGACATLCNNDGECTGSRKCCANGCGGTVCVDPTYSPPPRHSSNNCPRQGTLVAPSGCYVDRRRDDVTGCDLQVIRCYNYTDPCLSNPCNNLCETCVPQQRECVTSNCKQYRCESRCGQCTQCSSAGQCISTQYLCTAGTPDPCRSQSGCSRFPDARCERDSCDCRRATYVWRGYRLNFNDCNN